jgi:hypothetical protein
MKVDDEYTELNQRGVANKFVIRKAFQWRRDHDRIEILGDEWEDNPYRNIGPNPFVLVITDDQYLVAGRGGGTGQYRPIWNGQLRTKSFDYIRHASQTFLYSNFLEGNESTTSDDLFRAVIQKNHPHVGSSRETINGLPCWKVEAQSPDGNVAAWIDPDLGFIAARYAVDVSDQQSFKGRPVSTLDFSRWTMQVDIQKVQKIQNWYVPTAGNYAQTAWLRKGRPLIITETVTRSDINLSPDFAAMKAFRLDVPDGTPIAYDKAPGIPYEIREGQPQPRINPTELSELERALGQSSPQTQPSSQN